MTVKSKGAPSDPSAGRVGIFWVHEETLIAFSVDVRDGEDDGGFVNGHFDHVTSWPEVQRTHRGLLHLDYEEVPRGRVLFAREAGVFRVFLDEVLRHPEIEISILDRFGLTLANTHFLSDPHYTTNLDMLEDMFGW